MADEEDPNVWLEAVTRQGFVEGSGPYSHPRDPQFDRRVQDRVDELRALHQLAQRTGS